MADLAVTRSPENTETKAAVAEERVDEGRWEGEGGNPIPQKSLPHLPSSSSSSPVNSLARDSSKTHPREWPKTLDSSASQSHYSNMPDAKVADAVQRKSSAADSGAGAGDAKPASVERKKSITERMSEKWDEIKHKAQEMLHSKDSKDSKDSKVEAQK